MHVIDHPYQSLILVVASLPLLLLVPRAPLWTKWDQNGALVVALAVVVVAAAREGLVLVA